MAEAGPPMNPAVAVLMATFNGAAHLEDQLESLASQTLPPRWLIVGDDGSTDATRAILAAFARRHPGIELRVHEGPRRGAAMNFLSLLAHVPAEADVAGFCDQDDVWLPGKIADACAALGAEGPVLHAAATWVCDATLTRRRPSRPGVEMPGFRHALVQNIAGGNTMMVNRAGLDLLIRAARGVEAVVVHDWWAYQVVTGAGGRVVYHARPCLLYRQHGTNQIGANDGMRARLRRVRMLLDGTFRAWNRVNIAALDQARALLAPEAREVLDLFAQMRTAPLAARLRLLRQARLYRRDAGGNASLWLAAILGRI